VNHGGKDDRIARLIKAIDDTRAIEYGVEEQIGLVGNPDIEAHFWALLQHAREMRTSLEVILADVRAATISVEPLNYEQTAALDKLGAELDKKIRRNEHHNATVETMGDLLNTIDQIHNILRIAI